MLWSTDMTEKKGHKAARKIKGQKDALKHRYDRKKGHKAARK